MRSNCSTLVIPHITAPFAKGPLNKHFIRPGWSDMSDATSGHRYCSNRVISDWHTHLETRAEWHVENLLLFL